MRKACHLTFNILTSDSQEFSPPTSLLFSKAKSLTGCRYRCPALNRAVGGVPNSQHLKGEAADIILPPLTLNTHHSTLNEWFYWLIDNVSFDQLGFESKGTTKWIKPLRVFSSFAPRQFEQARLHSVWRRFTSAANPT